MHLYIQLPNFIVSFVVSFVDSIPCLHPFPTKLTTKLATKESESSVFNFPASVFRAAFPRHSRKHPLDSTVRAGQRCCP